MTDSRAHLWFVAPALCLMVLILLVPILVAAVAKVVAVAELVGVAVVEPTKRIPKVKKRWLRRTTSVQTRDNFI